MNELARALLLGVWPHRRGSTIDGGGSAVVEGCGVLERKRFGILERCAVDRWKDSVDLEFSIFDDVGWRRVESGARSATQRGERRREEKYFVAVSAPLHPWNRRQNTNVLATERTANRAQA